MYKMNMQLFSELERLKAMCTSFKHILIVKKGAERAKIFYDPIPNISQVQLATARSHSIGKVSGREKRRESYNEDVEKFSTTIAKPIFFTQKKV